MSEGATEAKEPGRAAVERRVLVVGSPVGLLTWAPVLGRAGVAVKLVRKGGEAVGAARQGDFRALVAIDPLPDLPVGALVQELFESPPSPLRGVLVVTSGGDDPPTLPVGEQLRVHCCDMSDGPAIEEAMVDLLLLEPRVQVRLEIELKVAIGDSNASVPGLTRNVSQGGILIQTGAPLRPGVLSHVSIELPELRAPVEGVVEVVRHRRRPEDRSSTVAVRFVQFSDDNEYRWLRFIENLR